MKTFQAQNINSEIKLTESITEDGSKYKCVFIKAGKTKTANKSVPINGVPSTIYKNYKSEAIKIAISEGVFEGAPVLYRSVDKHLDADDTGINTYRGYLSETSFNESTLEGEAIFNVAEINNASKQFKINLAESFKSGNPPELSISAEGEVFLEKTSGGYIANVEKISSCQSVDVVPYGNAGGRFIELIESKIKLTESKMNPEIKQKTFELLMAAGLIGEGKTVETVSDDDLIYALWNHACTLSSVQSSSLTEAQKTELNTVNSLLTEGMKSVTSAVGNVLNEMKLVSSNNALSLKLSESKLPVPVQDKIKKQYAKTVLSEAQITDIINDEKDVLARLTESTGANFGSQRIENGEDQVDKIQKAITYALMPARQRMAFTEAERAEFKNVTGHHSLKEIYRTFTGDHMITGKLGKMSLAESIQSNTWADILGVAMHRVLLAVYRTSPYDNTQWKDFVNVTTLTDFKTNTRTRKGGYADIPVVNESADYTAATTPGQEAVTYSLLKRGYTETVSREAIINDDLRAIQRIPEDWGNAAARTKYKYIFNLFLSNPTMAYDSKALFHAAHGNLMNDALDKVAYAKARKMLAEQKELSSEEKAGFSPGFLFVPIGLESVAYDLTTAAYAQANNVPEFHQTWRVKPIVVRHLTDDNNWYLGAAAGEAEFVEVGFLNGNEEPELFTQDDPRQGYAFTNDGTKFKIRDEYAGAVLDHRPIVGSIVP